MGKPGKLAGPGILQQVTSSVAAVGELRSIKLSNLDLDDTVIIENLLQLLRSSYNLIYCNLSYCQLQVHDLTRVVYELAKGTKLEYCDLSGNRARRPTMASGTSSGQAPDGDGNQGRNELETKTSNSQARQAKLSEKLASEIGSLLEQPQSALKFLGIADLGLPSQGLRRVAWSLQKNIILRSINFGVIDEERDLVMLSSMLGVEEEDQIGWSASSLTPDLRFGRQFSENSMTGEALVINAAMINQNRKATMLRSSTLMGPDNRQLSSP